MDPDQIIQTCSTARAGLIHRCIGIEETQAATLALLAEIITARDPLEADAPVAAPNMHSLEELKIKIGRLEDGARQILSAVKDIQDRLVA